MLTTGRKSKKRKATIVEHKGEASLRRYSEKLKGLEPIVPANTVDFWNSYLYKISIYGALCEYEVGSNVMYVDRGTKLTKGH